MVVALSATLAAVAAVVSLFVKNKISLPDFMHKTWLSIAVPAVCTALALVFIYTGPINTHYDELAELEFSNGESTEDEYIKKEFSEALNIFLGIISARERCIFVRRYFYAESSAKIAEKYGEKESNVNLILFRIRKKLKNYLAKEGFFI